MMWRNWVSTEKTTTCTCYEMMSNCCRNCWIDWNSAALCLKCLFTYSVHDVYVEYERLPDLCGISQPPNFVYGKFRLVTITAYMYVNVSTKKSTILKSTCDQKPETVFWGPYTVLKMVFQMLCLFLRAPPPPPKVPNTKCNIFNSMYGFRRNLFQC